MKFSCSKTLLALAVAAPTAIKARPDPNYVVDTSNKAPVLFHQPKARKGGYTYTDEMGVGIKASMDSGGLNMKGSFEAMGDLESKVTNTANGGKKMELTIQNIDADLKSFIMSMHCDSNNRKKSDPDCEEIFKLVGETETVEMDAAGEIIGVTTFEGDHIDMQMMTEMSNAMTLDDKFSANQFAASMHIDKTSQMLKLIPDHAVRPTDSWIDDVEMGGLGTFKGNSFFQGYTNYKGSNCAVFYFEGSLHLDISSIAQAVGADVSDLPSNMTDAKITNVIFWDMQDQISRWGEANVSTSFDIANPMDPSGGQVHIPVDLNVFLATDIIVRPDKDDEVDGDDTYDTATPYVSAPESSSSSRSSSNSGSSSGGGGFFKATFFVIVVGAAGAGGFMLYKKRQEELQGGGFVRPAYEFSPVGAQPIYNSPMV